MRHLALVVILALIGIDIVPVKSANVSDNERIASLVMHGCSTAALAEPSPGPSATSNDSPLPQPTPSIPPVNPGAQQLYATPRPSGTPATPLPLPTPTPA
ncbi:MAG: hypothetical protein M3Z14_01345, partial [Candidatus Eremiobacteraeota bacterium]|nr:hypothetical protein [Candidatus Eremiobacteraeota bacterium]